jgi:uncharacterized protein with von Willebrand factor type A (vWA) domain
MSYVADWKAAKARFEATTNQKKPVEKVLGAFKQSTGLEGALKVVDAAVAKEDKDTLKKGYQAYASAAMKYNGFLLNVLKDTMKAEGATADAETKDALMKYAVAVQTMTQDLEKIRGEIQRVVEAALSAKEMKPTYYLADWKAAKKYFEKQTGSKKPSEKFLGVFRKSSNLEKALEHVDEATLKNDTKNIDKYVKELKAAINAYSNTIEKMAKQDDDDYNKEVKELANSLERILVRAETVAKLA